MDHKDEDWESQSVEHQWVEVPCQRTVAGASFSQGVQDYVFSIARPQVFLPAQSYFRFELELLGAGDPNPGAAAPAAQPQLREGLALAENCVGSLYTNCFFLGGGQSVSQNVNFLAVANQVQARTGKSGSWQASVGQSAFGIEGSFSERCSAVSSTSTGAPIGISGLDDCREKIYKNTAANQFSTATVAVTSPAGVLTGVNTLFSASDVGSVISIADVKFTIVAFASATSLTISPSPSAAIAASTDWFCIKREILRSSEGRNRLQMLWQPPIGIFSYQGILASGDYRFQLSPDSNYQQCGVQTINPNYVVGQPGLATSTYTLNILDVKFYAAVAKMSVPDSVQELHLTEYNVQSKQMTSSNMSFSFSVPVSTSRMHVFLQAGTAGSNPNTPPSLFTVANGSDLNLQTLQLTYSNQTRPQTRWSSAFIANSPVGRNTSLLEQFYYQGLIERHQEDSVGGTESFNSWLSRGPLYSFSFARDQSDRSSDVQLTVAYNDPTVGVQFDTTSKIFLVSEFDRCTEITTSQGMITAVRSLNV